MESTCARASFLMKLQTWHSCFPVNFEKNFKNKFFTKRLLDSLCAVEKEPSTLDEDKEDENIISAIQKWLF